MVGLAEPLGAVSPKATAESQDDARFTVEARFYEKQAEKRIQCKLCPRACVVGDRERGYCGVRENRGGTYYTLVYSRACAAHIDPIEKKPFFHYLPGTMAFSVATAGCNVNCKFCQNWDISQSRPEQVPANYAPPARVAELARQSACPTIAYTYSEPVVFVEYLMDTADAGHAAGIRSIVVSNGYIQEEPLRRAYGKMDAVKIDLKSFSESYYRQVVSGQLKPVLETLVALRRMEKWLEVVYLVVPTLNDSEQEFRDLARWVKGNLGVDVPLHFSQFHADYLLKNLPITPVATLERAKQIADAEGLHYVYIGNVPGHPAENTYCPKCRKMLVQRAGLQMTQMLIRKGACPFCNHAIPGVWHV
ncbi:AmmeMemoRadiSam system radical SAM enzyme [Occallatibacter riparius]|uniref:AmmeMemoRadiSam system radical SAM enzyme n=1 Tax=Occallatibacter riparius TaxID=1002689 RepID=A0A9J7BLS6_9BACT|nr:AmmeMemoRadiSam system radical SAM enzyme [Occallatibacter riparius]UWZ83611.1 AmmeMemoRadiSam system radical SAM enzyme [Occallatibacter riparius]